MKKLLGLIGLVALASVFVISANAAPVSNGWGGSGSYWQEPEWRMPPREFDEVRQRGYRDGIVGAGKDFDNHRRPDVNNRDEYRHPHLPGHLREAYRRGFERGYQVGVEHIYNGR